jgi:glyoxylase-like metal-dependent hydrolase (beta-lactamase superfamily II)
VRGPVEPAPGVHGLGDHIVNWYVIEDGGRLTAVDAGLPGYASTLEADLRAAGFLLTDVDAVVLTHADGDHTGVAPVLQAAGARVLVHTADEPLLRNPSQMRGERSPRRFLGNLWRPSMLKIFGHTLRHGARPAKVQGAETFADGDVLDVPGRPRVVHTPGHTAGHCALHLADRGVLFAGDAVITHEIVTGGDGVRLMPSWLNEDNRAAEASLAVLEPLEADVLLPGHGEPWREGVAAAVASVRAH